MWFRGLFRPLSEEDSWSWKPKVEVACWWGSRGLRLTGAIAYHNFSFISVQLRRIQKHVQKL